MRDLLTKTMTGAMIAGAALLVAACGTNEEASMNNTAYTGDEALMEPSTNDVTAIDAGTTGADANLGMDANMTMDTNMTGGATMNTTTNTTGTMTNGM